MSEDRMNRRRWLASLRNKLAVGTAGGIAADAGITGQSPLTYPPERLATDAAAGTVITMVATSGRGRSAEEKNEEKTNRRNWAQSMKRRMLVGAAGGISTDAALTGESPLTFSKDRLLRDAAVGSLVTVGATEAIRNNNRRNAVNSMYRGDPTEEEKQRRSPPGWPKER